jgi:hypothetical protein
MEWEYWFLDMPKLRQGDVKTKIQSLEIHGWEFVPNGGDDRSEVLIFKRKLTSEAIPMREGCLLIQKKTPCPISKPL